MLFGTCFPSCPRILVFLAGLLVLTKEYMERRVQVITQFSETFCFSRVLRRSSLGRGF